MKLTATAVRFGKTFLTTSFLRLCCCLCPEKLVWVCGEVVVGVRKDSTDAL